MAKEPTIITVAKTEKDTYGNLAVTDTLGNTTKIGVKRENLHPLFIPGRAVKLIWANYQGKDYVSDAELFDGKPPPEKRIEPIKAGRDVEPLPPQPAIPGQQIGMTVKEIGDMIRAKYLMPLFGNEAGTELIKWYRGQILGTTKVPFDGSKLPDFKSKTKEE